MYHTWIWGPRKRSQSLNSIMCFWTVHCPCYFDWGVPVFDECLLFDKKISSFSGSFLSSSMQMFSFRQYCSNISSHLPSLMMLRMTKTSQKWETALTSQYQILFLVFVFCLLSFVYLSFLSFSLFVLFAFLSGHHADQMSEWSEVSKVTLCVKILKNYHQNVSIYSNVLFCQYCSNISSQLPSLMMRRLIMTQKVITL